MDDVKVLIDEIALAEAEAEKITSDALQEARRVNLEADAQAIGMVENARNAFKEEKKNVIASAEAEAEREYARIMALGHQCADKLRSESDTATAEIVIAEAFIKRYGSR